MTPEKPKVAETAPEPPAVECPNWHPVQNDWLWMTPTAGYCAAGPEGKVRVVADDRFVECCLPGRPDKCPDFRGEPEGEK